MAQFCAEKWRPVGGFARYILKNRRRFTAQNVAMFRVVAATKQRPTHTRVCWSCVSVAVCVCVRVFVCDVFVFVSVRVGLRMWDCMCVRVSGHLSASLSLCQHVCQRS